MVRKLRLNLDYKKHYGREDSRLCLTGVQLIKPEFSSHILGEAVTSTMESRIQLGY